MKFSDLFTGRLGGFVCAAALVTVIGGGCTSKKGPDPYTGIMGARGVIPPPYVNVEDANRAPAAAPVSDEPVIPADQLPPVDDFATPADSALNTDADFVVEDDVKPAAPAAAVAPAAPAPKPVVKPAPAVGDTYVVCKGDILSRIAAAHKIKLQDLLAVNPEITNPAKIKVGQKIKLPAGVKAVKVPAAKSTVKKAAPATLSKDGIYTVVSGDNLSRIAKRFGVKISEIREWNSLTSDALKIGQKLRLRKDAAAIPGKKPAAAPAVKPAAAAPAAPAAASAPAAVPGAEAVNPPAEVETVSVSEAAAAAPAVAAPAAGAVKLLGYSVADGDTLEQIANLYEISVDVILQHNPAVKSNADLHGGMEIKIPYNE